MARKKRKKSGKMNLLVTLVLIGLLGYAGFLFYQFLIDYKIIEPQEENIISSIEQKLNKNNKDDKNSTISPKETITNITENLSPKSTEQEIENNENLQETKKEIISNNEEKEPIKEDIEKSTKETPIKSEEQTHTKKDKTIEKKEKNSKTFSIYICNVDSEGNLKYSILKKEVSYTDSPIFSLITDLITFKKEGYLNLIPKKTKLLEAWINADGILTLNFNEEFLNNKYGGIAIKAQIYQIVNTVMQFSNVKGVKFLINGKTKKYYSNDGFLMNIVFVKNTRL